MKKMVIYLGLVISSMALAQQEEILPVKLNVMRYGETIYSSIAMDALLDRKQDKGPYLTSYKENDPTIYGWAKERDAPIYTAYDVGALPLVADASGQLSAVTIGNRLGWVFVGTNSFSQGDGHEASGYNAIALGANATVNHDYAYVWNGDGSSWIVSKGDGTFCVNPVGGIDSFYIGEQSLRNILMQNISGVDARLKTLEAQPVEPVFPVDGKNYVMRWSTTLNTIVLEVQP